MNDMLAAFQVQADDMRYQSKQLILPHVPKKRKHHLFSPVNMLIWYHILKQIHYPEEL